MLSKEERVKNILYYYRVGEYSYSSALYMLEAIMPHDDAVTLLTKEK
ncbi:MAG: hypothetical protein RBT52_02925 [Sulfurimonas sp.]|jgi:hypothetical protein|nr:hypothetical protein [Sulfurimonas sp.]